MPINANDQPQRKEFAEEQAQHQMVWKIWLGNNPPSISYLRPSFICGSWFQLSRERNWNAKVSHPAMATASEDLLGPIPEKYTAPCRSPPPPPQSTTAASVSASSRSTPPHFRSSDSPALEFH